MRYKTKITPEGTGYVGRILANEEVIYTSSVLNDPILVTRELSEYIASQAQSSPQKPTPKPPVTQSPKNTQYPIIPGNNLSNVSFKQLEMVAPPIPQYSPPVRRCCGRG